MKLGNFALLGPCDSETEPFRNLTSKLIRPSKCDLENTQFF